MSPEPPLGPSTNEAIVIDGPGSATPRPTSSDVQMAEPFQAPVPASPVGSQNEAETPVPQPYAIDDPIAVFEQEFIPQVPMPLDALGEDGKRRRLTSKQPDPEAETPQMSKQPKAVAAKKVDSQRHKSKK